MYLFFYTLLSGATSWPKIEPMRAILSGWVLDGYMLEYVLGCIVLIVVLTDAYLSNLRAKVLIERMTAEGDLLKENLNHLAGAIISMSELLDDADEVIENISKVPTVGEMIQQALVGFVTQKIQSSIPPDLINRSSGIIEGVIKENVVDEQYGKTQNKTKTVQE